MDLNIIFQPLPIRRGIAKQADYYVANRGADITVTAIGAEIAEFTPDAKIDVTYTQSYSKTTGWKGTLGAKLSDGAKGRELEFEPVELSREHSSQFTTSFSSNESMLTGIFMRDSIRWNITLPRAKGAIRDFLQGNLHLYATCDWNGSETREGVLEIRPSEVGFFDSNKEPLTTIQSMVMHYVLWRRGIEIAHQTGFSTKFSGV